MTRPRHERPLVAFTLLLQLAVGAFLAAAALDLSSAVPAGDDRFGFLSNAAFIAIVATTAAGLAFAFLHLGAPAHAWRSLANLRRSWLSREVLFAASFTALAAAFTGLRIARAVPPPLPSIVAAAAAICGVALVYSMARVYRLRTMPVWDTPLTTLSFFSATCLMGSLAAGAAVALWAGDSAPAAHVGVLTAVATGCFVFELGLEAIAPPRAMRLLLLGLGAALTVWAMLGVGPPGPSLTAAFAAATAALVVGRSRFFRLSGSRPL